ncbi:MAG: hypothetical protein DSZ28_04010 [Thiothrix sp.]|nr:MAG: hypothetical protein DSZ28_04010 [Thiothrix sp.]
MTDSNKPHENTTEDPQQPGNEVALDKKANNKVDKGTEIELPANRVIRKRIAARTIGVHLSALPPELQALKGSTDNTYLTKYDLPDEIHLTTSGGDRKTLSRDEAWEFADEVGSKLEWDILPDTVAGKATALFSTTGQGIYANYGRPTMDFSGFFHDYIGTSGKRSGGSIASHGSNSLMLGPVFIAMDTASAVGFTALGHITRGAPLANKTVLSDIASTGVYEGSTSWASAKLGVLTGAKVIRLAAAIPIPGVHLAAIPVGFLAGAAAAIFVKRFSNQHKDGAIDAAYKSVMHSEASDAAPETNPA